ncbi:myb-related transcription factor, partner of profilin-like [Haliotis rufescens]|uniref:myb-related transcription factor, partner of profilin-like n=1 Tax=Haliotis rufescens TaxID=6454 RepID=UPI00201F9214|nr:myb-related transcription factor, partner of profilin-like [Haliotis rufescens]
MTQPSTSAQKRCRQSNFTSSELTLLADEVKCRSHVLFGAFSSTITNQSKMREWDAIAAKVNACSSVERTGAQLRKKWNDYKSQVKRKAMDVRKESSKTGGGPAPSPLTDLEFKVVSLIPQCQIEGIAGGLESEVGETFPTLNALNEGDLATVDFFDTIITSEETQTLETPGPIFMCGNTGSDEASSMSQPVESAEMRVDETSHSSVTNAKDIKMNRSRQRRYENSQQPPKHIASIIDVETAKADALKELIDVQKRMLSISEEHLVVQRERLDLEKSKFELLQRLLMNPGNRSPNTLSPVINFMLSS